MKRGSWIVLVGVVGFFALMYTAGAMQANPSSEPEATPVPTPEPTPTLSAGEERARDERRIERAIWKEINERRADRGLRELYLDEQQSEIAKTHSWDMLSKGYYNHTSPNGTSFLPACRPTAEVLLKDSLEPAGAAEETVQAWIDSKSHREILFDSRWSRVGIGVAIDRSHDDMVSVNFC